MRDERTGWIPRLQLQQNNSHNGHFGRLEYSTQNHPYYDVFVKFSKVSFTAGKIFYRRILLRLRLCWFSGIQSRKVASQDAYTTRRVLCYEWVPNRFSRNCASRHNSVERVCLRDFRSLSVQLSMCLSSIKQHITRRLFCCQPVVASTWSTSATQQIRQVQTGLL